MGNKGGTDGATTGGRDDVGGRANRGGATNRGGGTSPGGTTNSGGVSGDGNGGSGGSVVIEPPHRSAQVDVLFVIDNSIGTVDKHNVLAQSVPTLIHGLVHPRCLDATGQANGEEAGDDGECPSGTPEFQPITDMHLGVVTSSLGSHGGGGACAEQAGDDLGQLLPLVRALDPQYPYKTWNESGFLSWNKDPSLGTTVETELNTNLRNMILNVGQRGCGFESTLEGMYRFLIDPQPLVQSTPVVTDPSGQTTPIFNSDASNPVLKQRRQFLRPDSTLAIVMLTDENDCSIKDSGQAWLVGTSSLGAIAFRMPHSTSVCERNPNDPCCASCAGGTPAGCPDIASDPACAQGSWMALDDNLNLRCFDQKRRFGVDLLYPLSRYVDGLTKKTVVDRLGKTVANPLFPPGGRTPSMVFLTAILGVPWQDIAADPNAEALTYLTPAELVDNGRWNLIVGSDGNAAEPPIPPFDKLMFETPKDRTTLFGNPLHPILGARAQLAPASTTSRPNAINGHESYLADNSSLQYACIMPLPQARPMCTGGGCECVTSDGMGNQIANMYNHAVCEGTTQTHAKAHPSLRQLRVIRDVAALTGNASPASVCWKTLETEGGRAPDYGYDPAIGSLLRAMAPQLDLP